MKRWNRTGVTLLLFLCAAGANGGCAWVDLTPEGEQVLVLSADAVSGCERLGNTRSRTTTKVGPFPRREEKIVEEQTALARNGAARMGGNAISIEGPAEDGEQDFGIYRCKTPAK